MGTGRPRLSRITVKRQPIKGSSKDMVSKAMAAQEVIIASVGPSPAPDWKRTAMRGKTTYGPPGRNADDDEGDNQQRQCALQCFPPDLRPLYMAAVVAAPGDN